MVIVTLSNGKRVANFASPHSFIFTDGTVLPAVSKEQSEDLKVQIQEQVNLKTGDITTELYISRQVWDEIEYWNNRHDFGKVDIVLCPLILMTALKESSTLNLNICPFRSAYIADKSNRLVSIDNQYL